MIGIFIIVSTIQRSCIDKIAFKLVFLYCNLKNKVLVLVNLHIIFICVYTSECAEWSTGCLQGDSGE